MRSCRQRHHCHRQWKSTEHHWRTKRRTIGLDEWNQWRSLHRHQRRRACVLCARRCSLAPPSCVTSATRASTRHASSAAHSTSTRPSCATHASPPNRRQMRKRWRRRAQPSGRRPTRAKSLTSTSGRWALWSEDQPARRVMPESQRAPRGASSHRAAEMSLRVDRQLPAVGRA